ncbi:efflux RND transporter periplasmic adaptor subunit [Candidatus Wolfebacteria bacterium]|nr:efflux RND transporter periplasmic adaptor subunit [Candidatus Wolfebacteria bacterium]
MLEKSKKLIIQHKLTSILIVIVLAGGGYFGYTKFFNADDATRYVSAEVKKGTLIVSISGSGQISAFNQIDIKPKASGDTAYVGVKNSQRIKAGALIAELDAADAQRAVRDAEANLLSAKLSLQKLKQPADALSILQARNSLAQAKESKKKAEDDLKKAFDDGSNTTANAFLDLPIIVTGLYDTLFSSATGPGGNNQWIDYYANAVQSYDEKASGYRNDAFEGYQKARREYDKNFADYKTTTRYSDTATIEGIINETYETTKTVAEAVKNSNNLIQFYKDKLTERNLKPVALADTHLGILNTYTGKTNAHLLNLLGIQNTIKNSRDTIVNSERSIAEKTESLAKLEAGADELDIQSAELTVKQRENALLDAKEKLADYFIRAPFDGVIAKLDVKKGDSVSVSTILATLITKQKIAEISLNEVDVVKIKVGQKATLTFDAVEGLSIAGKVAEIDAVGAVSQGVVTYTVKVALDTEDERVKTGMSVSAGIVTDVKPDILLVPNSAVKSQGSSQYVEVIEGEDLNLKNLPRRQNVETGVSNDEFIEIVSGLKQGDKVVARTIQPNATSAETQQQSGIRIPGLPGGGGRPR